MPQPNSDEWLVAVLEEYKALRAEIVATLSVQHTTLSFGTVAVGGLALAGFHDWNDGKGFLPTIIFLLLVPLVSYVILFLWIGEFARIARAGLFVSKIEQKVNDRVGTGAMGWECFLRTEEPTGLPQYTWNAWAVFVFLAGISAVSMAVGAARDISIEARALALGADAAVFINVVAFCGRQFRVALDDAKVREQPAATG